VFLRFCLGAHALVVILFLVFFLLDSVDRLFSTGVNSCIMKYYLCRRQVGSTGYHIPQHLNFCKRNVRTPAWVYNVIMSSWIIVRSGTLDVSSGEFLSSRVFYPQEVNVA
jgi:hypothetical protein